MNAKELSSQMEHSREGEFFAQRFAGGRVARVLTHSGSIGWRILVVGILLGGIAIPLKSAFVQLTQEAAARSTVQQVVKNLLPAGSLVSQQVDVGRHNIAVRLFSTTAVPNERQQQAQRTIQQKSGRPTQLSVLSVASQSDLAEMENRPFDSVRSSSASGRARASLPSRREDGAAHANGSGPVRRLASGGAAQDV